jgi:hypothetical protein
VSALDGWLGERELTLDEAKGTLRLSDDELEHGLRYEGLADVTMAHNAAEHPGRFYFQNGRLVMLYVSEPGIDEATLRRELGEPDATLRSRAGKSFVHNVYPGRGVAFSSDGSDVAFVEVFPPTSLQRYEAEIYEDPGEFIR